MYRELRRIGLTQYEAKIYQSILEQGRSDAKEVSRTSGVPLTAVYPNLKTLQDKGLIVKLDGSVNLYESQRPDAAIPTYIEKKQQTLGALGLALVKQAKKAKKRQLNAAREVVNISTGKHASHQIYKDLIRGCKRTFYVVGWRMESVGDKYNWLRRYRKLVDDGVDVRLIIIGMGEKKHSLIDAYKDAGIRIRYLPLDNFSLVIADGKRCKITLKGKNIVDKFNMHIDDADLASAMQTYFLMTWEKASRYNG